MSDIPTPEEIKQGSEALITRMIDIRGTHGPGAVAEVLGKIEDASGLRILLAACIDQINDLRYGVKVGPAAVFERYAREDDKWAWRLTVNGEIVATDGGQGYENRKEADRIGHRVVSGGYVVTDADSGTVLG